MDRPTPGHDGGRIVLEGTLAALVVDGSRFTDQYVAAHAAARSTLTREHFAAYIDP